MSKLENFLLSGFIFCFGGTFGVLIIFTFVMIAFIVFNAPSMFALGVYLLKLVGVWLTVGFFWYILFCINVTFNLIKEARERDKNARNS